MFQIYDCTGKPVGRPQGYKSHSTALSLVARPGSIRRAIYETFHRVRDVNPLQCLVYKIHPLDNWPPAATARAVAAEIVKRTGVPADRLIVSHVGGPKA